MNFLKPSLAILFLAVVTESSVQNFPENNVRSETINDECSLPQCHMTTIPLGVYRHYP